MSAACADVEEFRVIGHGLTVLCSPVGGSWGLICSTGHVVTGMDGPEHAGGVAVRHLRWHADGQRECRRCSTELTADEPGHHCSRHSPGPRHPELPGQLPLEVQTHG